MNDEPILGHQVKLVYDLLPLKTGVKRGNKKIVKELHDNDMFTYSMLADHFGLIYYGSWEGAFTGLSDLDRNKLKLAEESGDLDDEEIRIRVSSIHSAKGMEADNVIIDYTMGSLTWRKYQESKGDEEHRVAYVGVTRARKNLFLLAPMNHKHYEL